MNYHYVPNSLEYNQSFLDKRDLTCDCVYCEDRIGKIEKLNEIWSKLENGN